MFCWFSSLQSFFCFTSYLTWSPSVGQSLVYHSNNFFCPLQLFPFKMCVVYLLIYVGAYRSPTRSFTVCWFPQYNLCITSFFLQFCSTINDDNLVILQELLFLWNCSHHSFNYLLHVSSSFWVRDFFSVLDP